jgi:hypothetical protein
VNSTNSTGPKGFVFVLMPFSDEFSDIYELGIKTACQSAGAYCERVDEQIFVGNILDRIYNQISKADLIVADMTGRSPNVFYEVGYAHALNKMVILLTKDANDIPFDLKHYPHIVYSGKIQYLIAELRDRVRWCIENPTRNSVVIDLEIDFVVNDVSIVDNPVVPVNFLRMSSSEGMLSSYVIILMRNNCSHMIYESDISVSVLMNPVISIPKYERSRFTAEYELINVPNEGMLCKISLGSNPFFPKDWVRRVLMINIDKKFIGCKHDNNIIRLFTSSGPRDYFFSIDSQMRSE